MPDPQEMEGEHRDPVRGSEDMMRTGIGLLTGKIPFMMPQTLEPNCYRMSKSVALSGSGFATVAETLKQVDAMLEKISIETV